MKIGWKLNEELLLQDLTRLTNGSNSGKKGPFMT